MICSIRSENYLICLFCLAIGLRIERVTQCQLYILLFGNMSPEFGIEMNILITNNSI
jgi:hypothetical protein